MKNLTIIVFLVLSTMAYAQKGHKEGGKKGGGHGNVFNGNNHKGGGKGHKNNAIFQQKGHGNDGHGGKHQKIKFKGNGGHGIISGNHKGNKHAPFGHSGKGKGHYKKGHYPHYVFVSTHGFFSPVHYGYYRSQEAKKKHKLYHPVYEYEAIEGFNLILVRNRFLYRETDYKINLLRIRLADRRRNNLITVVEYDNNIRRIELLERRRAAVEVNISL
jgi:hypothetical protein